ncbi:3-deoxy-7-phosphoheptulonate synthase [bacterium]|nr:3-deoxy-7-phosphoheptulonate synthase [bacterium]
MTIKRTDNLRIEGFEPLVTPMQLKHAVPLTEATSETVIRAREEIVRIMAGEDTRRLMVVGPCSIHDPEGARDYARRLKALSDEVSDRILLVMRVYFEKPRTSVGWKGLISDPHLDDSCDMREGLRRARTLLAEIVGLGLPTAGEMLDPITPQYLADLVCWGTIGARTTESQTHREMASGLSFPVGFKNATNGDLQVAVNAMRSARVGHHFLGINEDGISCVVHTHGNPHVHVVLRGGDQGPNYEPPFVAQTEEMLARAGLDPLIMIDCSHANSGKDHRRQERVLDNVLAQIADGNTSIFGLMIESNLEAGNQPIPEDPSRLAYGVSVTDACIDWPTTERLIRSARAVLPRPGP